MPNDAKLGLVVGVGLVITVAVVFFRKDSVDIAPSAAEFAGSLSSPGLVSGNGSAGRGRVEARSAIRPVRSTPSAYQHTVQEGDTLFSLAQRYYGDKDKFMEIYQVNREILTGADALAPGMVLTIPNAPAKAEQSEEQPGLVSVCISLREPVAC